MEGIVREWHQSFDYSSGRLETEDGNYWSVASGKDVQTDSIGRCFLVPLEMCAFTPDHIRKNGKIIRVAKNVLRPWREMNIDPRTHRELCIVKNKNWLVRQLGGLLTTKEGELDGINPGAIVEVSVTQDRGFPTWRAFDLKFIAEDESLVDWNSTGEGIGA